MACVGVRYLTLSTYLPRPEYWDSRHSAIAAFGASTTTELWSAATMKRSIALDAC